MAGKWLYDIILNGILVGDQGDYEFDTKEEAVKDAETYISETLMDWYGEIFENFEVECYVAIY